MSSFRLRPHGPFRGDWRRRTGPRAAGITALCWLARLAVRPKPPEGRPLPPNPRLSALVIKPLALGDVLRATGFTAALRHGLPGADITFAVGDYAAPALANNPHIDEIMPMGMLGTPRRYDARQYLAFVRRIRERRFDAAFVLDRSPAMALLPYFARIPYRIGLDSRQRGFAHTTRLAVGMEDNEVETYRRLARVAGLDPVADACVFRPSTDDVAAAQRLAEEFELDSAALRVVVAPGGGVNPGAVDVTKRWPAERFAAVADWLIQRRGARICLVGTASDSPSITAMQRAMTQPAVNLAGRTTFGQLGALIAGSDLFVGNDSASAQLALGVDTPGVTVFTATEPWIYGSDSPRGVSVYTGGKAPGLGGPPPAEMATAAIRRLLTDRTGASGASPGSGASQPPAPD
ncbi:MAG: glycosyltransferase family 9 protein [Chloroflexi bacterium]|nr:glycosyltransferase family 9 protein [Chloroflexota bacterium]